jgi:hypothetical protein
MTNHQIPDVTPEAWAEVHLRVQDKPHHKRRSVYAMTLPTPSSKPCQKAAGVSLTLRQIGRKTQRLKRA